VYDCINVRQVNQYARTTKEITEFAGKFETDQNSVPADPIGKANRTELKIWLMSL
jgi:hypothetical protein